jgi:excinuclease ABC subunit A
MEGIIKIRGARENNLQNISLEIPKFKLVVVTGPSGSGKSTLAMDTLQRECQRQYMESMGMVSDSVSKPKVDAIEGLSPSISVGQHVTNRNPRSTIGTVTDIFTLLRILFAKLGERDCPSCGDAVLPTAQSAAYHGPSDEQEEETAVHEKVWCGNCGYELDQLTMSHFSFNKPEGACETCSGLGHTVSLDPEAVFNPELSLRDGAVAIWYSGIAEYSINILKAAARHYDLSFDEHLPLKEYSELQRDLLYYGVESEQFSRHFPDAKAPKSVGQGKFEGVLTGIWRRYREKGSESGEAALFQEHVCPECQGTRLKASSRQVRVDGVSISEVNAWSIGDAMAWTEALLKKLSQDQLLIVEAILHDSLVRLRRIVDVGLGYMSLDRQVITMSGGEAQRLRLASILGSGLTGVLYILDEPTTGLHPRDTRGLIQVLKHLRDLGNTVLVIEHDEEVMRAADHIIDIGPGAGTMGGTVVGQGTLKELIDNPLSITGAYFRENAVLSGQVTRRTGNGDSLTIHDAFLRNLKNVTVSFPLGCLISVTGVSGSGKSTLLFDLLAQAGSGTQAPAGCREITGWDSVGQLVTVDQSPVSRMQRSNIATYTDVYTHIRNWFASLPEARRGKLTAKHFSFNTPGGRCETCQGLGVVPLHMHFLPEIEVRCPDCRGKRFKQEVLDVTYNGYSISDILDITVKESLELLEEQPKIREITSLLCEVGLGYLKWGQSVRTLSGGEGQRIKLAKELNKKTRNHTLYLLDEPSTGLHPGDVRQLLVLLNRLVDAGNTVILVEHNLDLIWHSDWIVDIGPGGGAAGGAVVAEGTPEQIATVETSHTGRFLKELYAVK